MPISPPSPAGVYDSLNTILNSARFRLNDKLKSLQPFNGKILDETIPSTQQAVNNAWRKFQSALSGFGVEKYKGEVIISNVPPTTNMDPASKCSLSWFNFFDGTNYSATPILPSELIIPLWMSERTAGQNRPFPRPEEPNMRNMPDGLTLTYKFQANREWEWRDEILWIPGAIIAKDFRIGYRKYLRDFVDVGARRWWTLDVPLIRCQDPFSWAICAEFCFARAADGDAAEQMLAVAESCQDQADKAARTYANDTAMKNQRDNQRRIPYGRHGRGRGVAGYGYGGC